MQSENTTDTTCLRVYFNHEVKLWNQPLSLQLPSMLLRYPVYNSYLIKDTSRARIILCQVKATQSVPANLFPIYIAALSEYSNMVAYPNCSNTSYDQEALQGFKGNLKLKKPVCH